jgi:eukaryotic-like serine/threonine-protein kinase
MPFETNQPAYRSFRAIVAERTRPLLAWTGSGLSAEAGLPTWLPLKELLVESVREKAAGLDAKDAQQLSKKADAAESQQNNWIAFKMLHDSLGKTSYREVIKEAYSSAPRIPVPDAYKCLWRLRIRGVLNLNLDRLATRALSEHHPGTAPLEFNGPSVARLRHLLNGHSPFIGNLHGTFEDAQSWTLTKDELSRLQTDAAYLSFIETCLSMFTVFFVGISADDLAVGGHLDRLSGLGIETPTHYWLTDRRDIKTDEWAERAGIRLIRYTARDGDHAEVAECFQDLLSYIPEEPIELPPIAPTVAHIDAAAPLASPMEMVQWNADEIRVALNNRAQVILKEESLEAYQKFSEFCDEYDQAIYRAWYTTTRDSENTVLGYRLVKEKAKGAFGRVYEAEGPNGERVAVKILLEEIRNDPDHLRSFRRGVRSMRILQQRDVEGMVAYLEASEIPAFVVMEWIEGPNLAEATQAKQLSDWADIIKVAVQLSRIIRKAHELPERVLHRDLRPSNVMLEGFYTEPNSWQVVVLDFDLSWHKGAFEKSVLHNTVAGYLAPEQMHDVKGVSTRNAAVDSFGLGMTLLYLCSGNDPLPDQHRHQDWTSVVENACKDVKPCAWRSMPQRVARIILKATQDKQASRWDMAEISGELERLMEAVNAPEAVRSTELLAEELASHCEVMAGYVWDADAIGACRELHTGMKVAINADLLNQRLVLHLNWTSTGVEERKNLGKYVVNNSNAAADQLAAAGWSSIEKQIGSRAISIKTSIGVAETYGRFEDLASVVDKATRKLQFTSP